MDSGRLVKLLNRLLAEMQLGSFGQLNRLLGITCGHNLLPMEVVHRKQKAGSRSLIRQQALQI